MQTLNLKKLFFTRGLKLLTTFVSELNKIGVDVDLSLAERLYNRLNPRIQKNAKIILFPIATAPGVVYAMDNSTGKPVEFTFSRASSATLFDSNKNLQLVNNDMPRIDYGNYTDDVKLLIEREKTNLLLDSTFELGINQHGAGFNIEDSNWLNFIPKKAVLVKGTATSFYYKTYVENNANSGYIFSSFLYSEGQPIINSNISTNLGSNTGNRWSSLGQSSLRLIKDNIWFITRNPQTSNTGNKNIGWVKYTSQNDIPLEVAAYQLESGDIATSYIPTTDTAATRAADLLTYTLPTASQVYIKTTKQNIVLDKPAGTWNIHNDLNNEGIEVLAVL